MDLKFNKTLLAFLVNLQFIFYLLIRISDRINTQFKIKVLHIIHQSSCRKQRFENSSHRIVKFKFCSKWSGSSLMFSEGLSITSNYDQSAGDLHCVEHFTLQKIFHVVYHGLTLTSAKLISSPTYKSLVRFDSIGQTESKCMIMKRFLWKILMRDWLAIS